jgi:hypothetical protein
MDELISLLVFLVSGIVGVGIMRFFRNDRTRKDNNKVVEKIKGIENKNNELTKQILDNLTKAANKVAELEKEKNVKTSNEEELADWFNSRKSDKH